METLGQMGCPPQDCSLARVREDHAMCQSRISSLRGTAGGAIAVACDTEFDGPLTLTAQFALRLGDQIVVQLYKSPEIPSPPRAWDPGRLSRGLRRWCAGVVVRPV